MNRNTLFSLIVLILICLPFTYGGCGGGDGDNFNPLPTVVGSGNIVQETRSVTGATGVNMVSVANLTIEQGAPEELILQTDDNLMALIFTDVEGGILVIQNALGSDLQPSQTMEANLTLISIDSIILSGFGSNITVPDLTTLFRSRTDPDRRRRYRYF